MGEQSAKAIHPLLESRVLVYPMLTFIFLILLILATWQANWLEVNAKGVFTEGMSREPTLWMNYTVDNEQEKASLEITNSTPLLIYWATSEPVENNTTDEESSTSDDSEGPSSVDGENSGENFSLIRRLIKTFLLLSIVIFAGYLSTILGFAAKDRTQPRRLAITFLSLWGFTLLMLVLAIPMSAMDSFSGENSYNFERPEVEPGSGFGTGNGYSASQFAHTSYSSSYSTHQRGLTYHFFTSGYDLGLLNESMRESVRANPPQQGEDGYDSLITMQGNITMSYGDAVFYWLMVPLILLFAYRAIPSRIGYADASKDDADAVAEPFR